MATTFPVRAQTDPAIKEINELIAVLRKTGKEANLTEKEINEMVASVSKARTVGAPAVGAINKEMSHLNSAISKIGPGLAGLFAVDRLRAFFDKIVTVRAEFEKLSAVLTNTLGSQSRAQEALRTMQEIAAKTPYSVLQWTQSYVKLVNQGIKPTNAEIIKMGDLAASTGKEIDQLTEAIIDAQTGEFERLKEFGIRANKEGDRVTFTFKGIKQQVDFTSESIQQYIFGLGELEGVSGSMAAISETLGGKISNLGDSFDKLANVSGEAVSPFLKSLIDDLNNAIGILTDENLGKFEKFISIFNTGPGASAQRAQLIAVLDFQRELLNTEKERAIQGTVNAALQSENIEAYIKALDSNIYKEEIIARIREKQAKDANDAATTAEKARKKALESYKNVYFELSGLDEKAIKQYQEQNELAEIYKDTLNEVKKALDRIDEAQAKITKEDPFGEGFINADGIPSEDVPEIAGLKSLEDIEQQKQDLRQQTFDHAIALSNNLFDFFENQTRREIDLLKGRYDYEISLVGENEDAKRKIEKKFQAEQAKLLEKQNEQQRQQALFNILISQGPALAKTVATSGFPAAIPLVALVLAQFGLLLANQGKVQAPRYAAKGDFDIKGSGTETSDSNPYWLSVHETVAPAHATKKFPEVLKNMLDPKFGWLDLKGIVDRKLPRSASDAIIIQTSENNVSDLLDEIRATHKTIKSKTETRIHFDEDGFGVWTGNNNQWTKYVNSRYSPPTR